MIEEKLHNFYEDTCEKRPEFRSYLTSIAKL